jgi:hypothetical protein
MAARAGREVMVLMILVSSVHILLLSEHVLLTLALRSGLMAARAGSEVMVLMILVSSAHILLLSESASETLQKKIIDFRGVLNRKADILKTTLSKMTSKFRH